MGIVSVDEAPSGHEFSYDGKERSYTRTFLVTVDSDLDRQLTVASASGIPQYGSTYSAGGESDPFAFVKTINASKIDKKVWQVVVNYSSIAPEDDDPLTADPQYEWGSAQFSRVVDRDNTGTATLNSAGDGFDPSIEKEDSRDTLRVSRNELAYDPSIARAFKNKVNADTFYGWAPGQAKVFDIAASSFRHTDGNIYWRVSYEIHFSLDGFQPKVLDQGYRYLEGGEQKPITVTDEEGQVTPVSSPKLLDGNGGILPEGGTPVFLDFEIYGSVSFAGMNL